MQNEKNEKVCVTVTPGLHGEIKVLCKDAGIKIEFAYSTGMRNWVRGMKGQGSYRPIYQPDHDLLERILLHGNEQDVAALRAVMEAFTPPE